MKALSFTLQLIQFMASVLVLMALAAAVETFHEKQDAEQEEVVYTVEV